MTPNSSLSSLSILQKHAVGQTRSGWSAYCHYCQGKASLQLNSSQLPTCWSTWTILQQLGHTQEQHNQLFHSLTFSEFTTPLPLPNSSETPVKAGCWLGSTPPLMSLTKWCWSRSLLGCQRRQQSWSSDTIQHRWKKQFNWWKTT